MNAAPPPSEEASVVQTADPGTPSNAAPRTPATGEHRRSRSSGSTSRQGSPAMIPILLLGVGMLIWLGFQCWQLVVERDALEQAYAGQVRIVENATQFRAKLNQVARETQLLADKGNANARLVVEELRKRGITIDPRASPAGVPGASERSVDAGAK